MVRKILIGAGATVAVLAAVIVVAAAVFVGPRAWRDHKLRGLLNDAAVLPLVPKALRVVPPHDGWAMGMVSWIATDTSGLTYLLQRSPTIDPVIVVNREGLVVRSWGRGMFTTPHSIRIAPDGNVWTTDAKTSRVVEFSPEGKFLSEIAVGGLPEGCESAFCGTTDVAFGPDGRIFVSDGYRNARVLEYSADGRLVREWGRAGSGRGEFRLPHSLVVDDDRTIWVADRENGRVQRFDLQGKWLGELTGFGKTFSLDASDSALWLGTQQLTDANFSPGWVLKVDRRTGELRGYVSITGIHGIDVSAKGELLVGPGAGEGPLRLSTQP
ncbi:MAG TPA: 6-bladed beta-propeller [Vicinamibacterales bacterium]|nr:6-bladed beta-propeller [Vicinamibacterales bacterium]